MAGLLRRVLGVAKLDTPTFEGIRDDPKANKEALAFLGLICFVNALSVAFTIGVSRVTVALFIFLSGFLGWLVQVWLILQISKLLVPSRKLPGFEQLFRVLTFSVVPMFLLVLALVPLSLLPTSFIRAGLFLAIILSAWFTLAFWKGLRTAFRYEGGALDALVMTFVIMGILVGMVALVLGMH